MIEWYVGSNTEKEKGSDEKFRTHTQRERKRRFTAFCWFHIDKKVRKLEMRKEKKRERERKCARRGGRLINQISFFLRKAWRSETPPKRVVALRQSKLEYIPLMHCTYYIYTYKEAVKKEIYLSYSAYMLFDYEKNNSCCLHRTLNHPSRSETPQLPGEVMKVAVRAALTFILCVTSRIALQQNKLHLLALPLSFAIPSL